MRRALSAALWPAVFAVSVAAPSAVSPRQPAEPTSLTAAPAAAPPGASAVLSYTLAVAAPTAVARVESRLTYPSAQLKFVKAEPSGLVLAMNGTVAGVVENGPDGKSSTVRVTIAAPADGGQPLPPGPLAYLTFAVDKSAKPETAIELAQVATAFTAGPDAKPVTPLSAPKLKITVARPPVPACFFYMH